MNKSFEKLDIGISACLLGEKVRFDGGHKNLIFANQVLTKYANYHPICPEVGIGLPVPRPTIRLVEIDQAVSLVDSKTGQQDFTQRMRDFSQKKMPSMQGFNAFIVTSKSPSCGMERLKVYDQSGQQVHRNGVGIFTQTLMQNYPNLPIEEDGRLNDLPLRENFIERVYIHQDWQQNVASSTLMKDLVAFHARRKYQIMAHSYQAYKTLGKLVANHEQRPLEDVKDIYFTELMQACKKIASRKRHSNVMQHIQGYFKNQLSSTDKAELVNLITQYRNGLIPLLAPLTLLKHFLIRYPNDYLEQQSYFNPYPLEMGLNG